MRVISKHFKELEDLKGLWPFLKPYKAIIILMLLLIFIHSAINLVTPYIYKLLVDLLTSLATHQITLQEASQSVLWIAGGYIAIMLVGIVISAYKGYFGDLIVYSVDRDIKSYSLEKVLSFDYDFTEKNSTGKTIQKIERGTSKFIDIYFDIVYWIIPQILEVSMTILLLLYFAPQLAIVSVILLPIYVWVTIKYTNLARALEEKITPALEKASKQQYQVLSLFELVKSYAKEHIEHKKYSQIYHKATKKKIDQSKIDRTRYLLQNSLKTTNIFLVLLFGSYLAIQGEITIGTVVMFLGYTTMIYNPLEYLTEVYRQLKVNAIAIQRMTDLLFKNPRKITDSPNAINLKKVAGKIELKNIFFCYEKDRKKCVLKDIDLKIKPGECVAVVGPSGGGKSTLIKLLLRFYDVDKGQILIDNKDIKEVTQKSLRENISYVPQDPGIFNDTIRANIKYGKLNARNAAVEEAAKNANIHDFITKTPNGYKTIVGERGIKLSGGEKQRVALARAFLKDAPILVLDEATAALDSESEEKIQSALWRLAKNKTTIIIAHRLSTVMKADRIVVVDKGRVVETGSHKELLKKKNGLYNKLFKIQSGAMLLK